MTTITSNCEGAAGARMDATLGYLCNSNTPGTHGLYRCHTGGGDYFVSIDSGCEGSSSDGLLGYIWNAASSTATVAIYRCHCGKFHMTSVSSSCEGAGTVEGTMGYAAAS